MPQMISAAQLNKTDLARQYFPEATPQSALRMLNRYMHRAVGLLTAPSTVPTTAT